MKTSVTCIIAACLAVGAAQADGLSQSFTVTQNLTGTDWSAVLAIPKFNVSGAILDSAVLTYGGSAVYSDSATNNSPADGTATLINSVILDFGYNSDMFGGAITAGNELISNSLSSKNTQTLAVPVSAKVTVGPVNANLGPATYNVADLSPLTGAGVYLMDIAAAGSSTIRSNIFNISSTFSTAASAYVTVTYNYHLDTPSTVSVPWAPPALQLLLAGGLLGIARRFRNK